MDLLEMLKLSNIFSPNGQMTQQNFPVNSVGGMQQPQNDTNIDINGLMQMLNPKDEQFDQFTNLIRQFPQRTEPSTGRKIAGFIAGLGAGGPLGISGGQPIGYKSDVPSGLKIQDEVMNAPYNRQVSDWMTRANPTLEAAKLENTKNVNTRVSASNVRSAELRDKSIERQIEADKIKAAHLEAQETEASARTEISRQRAAAYKYDKEHPNHVYDEDSEGYAYSIDPKTNKVEYLFDDKGNKIKGDKLSDEMRLKIQHENRLSEISTSAAASGAEARKTEETRQENRKELEPIRAAGRVTAKEKAETPTAKQVRLYNRALEGINKNPTWKDYISIDAVRKIFRVATPEGKKPGLLSKGTPGGNPKIAQEILKYIYGDEAPSSKETTTIKPNVRTSDGKTHVKKKATGETGWVTNPNTDIYELIP